MSVNGIKIRSRSNDSDRRRSEFSVGSLDEYDIGSALFSISGIPESLSAIFNRHCRRLHDGLFFGLRTVAIPIETFGSLNVNATVIRRRRRHKSRTN